MAELSKAEELFILEDHLRLVEAKMDAYKAQIPHLKGVDAMFANKLAIEAAEEEAEELLDALMELYDLGLKGV